MWKRQFQEAWTNGKRTVGNMWNHAVKYAGQIDHAMGVGKRIFSALQPAIQDAGGGGFNRAVMQGIGGYEQGQHVPVFPWPMEHPEVPAQQPQPQPRATDEHGNPLPPVGRPPGTYERGRIIVTAPDYTDSDSD